MNSEKQQFIKKMFGSKEIRSVWDSEKEIYYISVIDVVTILSGSNNGRKYWNKLKQRLISEGNESVTKCHQLKLKATDGKHYKTDVIDIEGIFRIIESVPSKKAEPIKRWLSKLGSEG